MTDRTEVIKQHILELLSIKSPGAGDKAIAIGAKVYLGTISIASKLYGADSPQVKAIEVAKERIAQIPANHAMRGKVTVDEMQGFLQTVYNEIEAGLVISLQSEARGEVLADFVAMAKTAIDNNVKEVAAVLACAALEDTLKKYAEVHGLDVYDKDMSEAVRALKSKGLVKGPTGKIMQSFVAVRNKAFHAQWDRVDTSEIQSIIAFVEDFLVKRF